MHKGLIIRQWGDRQGFTLLEVVIAIFVLLIALLGLISVTVMIIKGNDFSKRITMATTLAKDKMEEVRNLSYNSIPAGTTIDYRNQDSSAGTAGAYFTRKLTVWSDTPAVNMKTIEVEVSWTWGATRKVTLRTIVSS